jgi:hypothetical protein
MLPSLAQLFARLNCFKRARRESLDGRRPSSCDFPPKEPAFSVHSIASPGQQTPATDLEKQDPLLNSSETLQTGPILDLLPKQQPRTNAALIVASKRQYEYREDFPFPHLQNEQEVIIRTEAVGLNPIDWKSVDYNFCLPEFPWITGREMSGVVEQIGSEVTGLFVGQRVWTSEPLQNFSFDGRH